MARPHQEVTKRVDISQDGTLMIEPIVRANEQTWVFFLLGGQIALVICWVFRLLAEDYKKKSQFPPGGIPVDMLEPKVSCSLCLLIGTEQPINLHNSRLLIRDKESNLIASAMSLYGDFLSYSDIQIASTRLEKKSSFGLFRRTAVIKAIDTHEEVLTITGGILRMQKLYSFAPCNLWKENFEVKTTRHVSIFKKILTIAVNGEVVGAIEKIKKDGQRGCVLWSEDIRITPEIGSMILTF
jgi:hypothetical protein